MIAQIRLVLKSPSIHKQVNRRQLKKRKSNVVTKKQRKITGSQKKLRRKCSKLNAEISKKQQLISVKLQNYLFFIVFKFVELKTKLEQKLEESRKAMQNIDFRLVEAKVL